MWHCGNAVGSYIWRWVHKNIEIDVLMLFSCLSFASLLFSKLLRFLVFCVVIGLFPQCCNNAKHRQRHHCSNSNGLRATLINSEGRPSCHDRLTWYISCELNLIVTARKDSAG